ncbi:MAG: hypothetical protein ACTHN0_09605, partial [Aquihabitans sp.]
GGAQQPERRGTTERAATSTTPASGGSTTTAPFEAGATYRSPDGWSIDTGSGWIEGPAPIKGAMAWYVAGASDGFRPNVGVIVQPGQGIGLDQYLDISTRSLRSVEGGKVIDTSVETADDGTEIGTFAYKAKFGSRDLRFYATAVQQGDDMILATFTCTPERYDDLAREVEPLLRTLRAG